MRFGKLEALPSTSKVAKLVMGWLAVRFGFMFEMCVLFEI